MTKGNITFGTAYVLRGLITKLPFSTYEDFELIKSKIELLDEVAKQFGEIHKGDQQTANENAVKESALNYWELSFVSLEDFKKYLPELTKKGLDIDGVMLMEYWLVLESE